MNETLLRSLSGAVYVFLLLFATIYSRASFLVLFGFFLLQTVYEFSKIIQLQKFAALLVAIILFVLFGVFQTTNFKTDVLLIVACLYVLIQLLFWLFSNSFKSFFTLDKWVKLIGYIVLPFVFMAKIVVIQNKTTYYPYLLIGIFILIWTNDSFAYIVGKSVGKHKLFEKISPKKTVEGFVGGVLFAVVVSVFISNYFTIIKVTDWVVISIIVSVFGTLGDLVQSKFKRIAGVKDSGTIMPGHGGIYDRLDSIIFVIPFVYLFLKIIGYVS